MGQADEEMRNSDEIFITSRENRTVSNEKSNEQKGADFETAIEAAGFGRYNLLLFFVAIPCCLTALTESVSMSYVFPAAQCDLNLSLDNKGMLNAITYAGMLCSGFLWGFLADALGRRKLLITGYLLDFCFAVLNGFTQNFQMLVVSKFFGGFIINGPSAALSAYLSEFHSAKYRSRVSLAIGLMYNIGGILLPLGAWLILPQNLNYSLFGGRFEIHSWNIFLFICCISSLVSFILFFFFMPESGKYLMTAGRNEEALLVFQKVYVFNTGKPADTYPIKKLIEERSEAKIRTKKEALKDGLKQLRTLFYTEHISKLALFCTIFCGLFLSYTSLKLWLPQIFTAVNDYQYYNDGISTNLCEMLDIVRPNNSAITGTTICTVNSVNASVYINSIIVAVTAIVGYIFAGCIINITGKKPLIFGLTMTAGLAGISTYFATDATTTLILTSLFIASQGVALDAIVSVIIDAFPTTLRAISLSTISMLGRAGAVTGNLVFPILLNIGCLPPFLLIGLFPIVCAFLSFLLPKTDLKALE